MRSRRTAVHAQAATAVSGWEPLGGFVTADPAVALDPADANSVFTFVRGGEGALYWRHGTTGAWSAFEKLGGYLTSLPYAVSDPTGASGTAAAYVFVRGGEGALYVGKVVGGVWQGFQSLGGYLTSYPTAMVDASGIWVAVRGGDGALYTRHLQGNVWTPWQPQGGGLLSAPYVGTNGAGTYAMVVGLDFGLYARTLPNGPWTPLGGILTSPPIPVSDDWGMDVIARWADRSLAMTHLWGPGSPGPGGWSGFLHAGGQLTSAPLAISSGLNVMVYARGTDNALWRNRWDGFQWLGWTWLGGFVISDTVPVLDGNHLEHTFVIGGDGALYTIAVDISGAAAGGVAAQSVDGTNAPPPGDRPHVDEYGVFTRG